MNRFVVFFLFCLLGVPLSVHAAYTVYGSGTGTNGEEVSAQADFDIVAHDFGSGPLDALQITVSNTADTTAYRGNLLTGIFVDFVPEFGDPWLITNESGFDGLAFKVWTSSITSVSNVDIAPATRDSGMYTLGNGPFNDPANNGSIYSAYDFGIATVAYGISDSGFNGSIVGGDNYGIAAPGSDLTSDGLPMALPIIDAKAIFWILMPEGFDLTKIAGANFAFGSLPDNDLTVVRVPEPSTILLLGTGLVSVACVARRRKKQPF